MDFDLQWLLWALPVAFALGWLGSRWDTGQRQRELKASPKAYYKGLSLLLNEQHDKAIDAFIEAVQHDPDTFDLHFALGNLFRRRGEYERAVRVHQHLLGRADLGKADRERAQHALAQDFMKAGIFDRAEQAYRSLANTSYDTESRLALLDLLERGRDWRGAIAVAQQLEASGAGSFAGRLGHYWCELALEADAAADQPQGDAAIAAAREVAPTSPRPLVLAGERAAARGDPAEALRAWNTLMSVQPAAFNLVAGRYAAAANAAHAAEPALERLQALYERNPSLDLLETVTALQSDAPARTSTLLAHLREHPTLASAGALLSRVETTAAGLDNEQTRIVADAVRRAARPLHRYRCAACGFEVEHYFWQCPGCLGWDTYPPQRLEDL